MKLVGLLRFLALAPAGGITMVAAAPAIQDRDASVTVEYADGSVKGSSLLGIERFNGIPYADAPTGPLRLRPPKKLSRKLDGLDVRGIAPACPQMLISSDSKDALLKIGGALLNIPFVQDLTGREDCLTVDVHRPAGTKPGDKLPVLFWVFGGGFELGSTSTYDAGSLLADAVDRGQPFVYVAVNYRVGGFGFLPGRQVLADGAANLGLLDQRMGLEWVADNVEAFGGDPDRVVIWGQSAGAISAFNQMVLHGGDAKNPRTGRPLFRGAIMDSGALAPADPVDCPKSQAVYDAVLARAGCKSDSAGSGSGSGDSDGSLDCLRRLDYHAYLDAVNSVPGIFDYSTLALSYLPRPDGTVLPESPDRLADAGRIHRVPFIIGDQEDEGTLFALFTRNVTSSDRLVDYLSDHFFHNATRDQLAALVDTYPDSASAGSPFRTGILNDIYPGFKRVAAILGDLTFTLNRRGFLQRAAAASDNNDLRAWSYLASYDHLTPVLGTFHASDVLQVFYGTLPNHAGKSARAYYFNFLYNLDPNDGPDDAESYDEWPRWAENQDLMWFKSAFGNDILADDFRKESSDWISDNRAVLNV